MPLNQAGIFFDNPTSLVKGQRGKAPNRGLSVAAAPLSHLSRILIEVVQISVYGLDFDLAVAPRTSLEGFMSRVTALEFAS